LGAANRHGGYVLTDRAVIDELREAAERGVKVRIWRDASEAEYRLFG
jgi:phosphatidylserine/phosphatidylglycerophosphate/cardiolipin synthase-like enzyme